MGSPIGRVAFSILMGLCAALALPDSVALGDEVYPPAIVGEGPDPCPVQVAPDVFGGIAAKVAGKVDPVVDLVVSGGVAVALIIGMMAWVRLGFPESLAPEPATQSSRLKNIRIALLFGVILGLVQVAPAVPLANASPDGWMIWLARALGGFMASTSATFGRDIYIRSKGAAAERKEAKIAAGSP